MQAFPVVTIALSDAQVEAIWDAASAKGVPRSVAALARGAGVNRTYLSKVLGAGRLPVGPEVREKLTNFLDLAPDVLHPRAGGSELVVDDNGVPAGITTSASHSNGAAVGSVTNGGAARARDTVEVVDWSARPRRPVVGEGVCGVPCPLDGAEVAWSGEMTPVPDDEHAMRRIGTRGYAVRIRGASMTRWGFGEGDLVWVNPDLGRAAGYNKPVLARLLDPQGADLGMVIKLLRLDQDGTEYLQSDGDEGDNDTRYRAFEVCAVCVWHQPAGGPVLRRGASEEAPAHTVRGPRFLADDDEPRRSK